MTAKDRGEAFVLNGTKAWTTNGYEAEAAIIFATTDRHKKHKGISAFITALPAKGESRNLFLHHKFLILVMEFVQYL